MPRFFNSEEIPPSPDLHFESALWSAGVLRVAGVDEAGRGAWAGPVSAGAVIFPPNLELPALLPKVRDSKQMTPKERDYWAEEIKSCCLAWSVGFASNEEIDQLGILPATRLAMARALESLPMPAEHLLIDALRLPEVEIAQTPLIKGDARSLSIASASILAKTARDSLMIRLNDHYPEYNFARHKGYGTAAHQAALQNLGPCPIHRCSFAPIMEYYQRKTSPE
ncbi:MAG: ribonuclease HII [Chloroflexi bacterium]|nr:ribonuclease HII [Chloroflexota bacterium]